MHSLHQSVDALCDEVIGLLDGGKLKAAWTQLQTLAQTHPNHAPIHRLQGLVLQQSGYWDLALAAYRHALTLAPNDSQLHTAAALCLHRQGALPEALAHF